MKRALLGLLCLLGCGPASEPTAGIDPTQGVEVSCPPGFNLGAGHPCFSPASASEPPFAPNTDGHEYRCIVDPNMGSRWCERIGA